MTGEVILGVDPGLSGALAFLTIVQGEPVALDVHDVPTFEVKTANRKTRQEMNCQEVGRLITLYGPRRAFIEQVGAMPGQGVVSMFRFGFSAGVIHGALGALRIPTHTITPQEWCRLVRLQKGDGASRMLASRLFPEASGLFSRVKDHGRADAALIAWAGYLRA
jgi:crossover junction endodeoxyribonuclease RuvC